ncbi:hypothetical protein SARC_12936 [Sphaeroforma arctica JP610]|uniref:F-box domain-containing protein n=1 Tax=Sphaeroforma arctica JP610 TaxID=667725 RepID=A0A0L0FCM0_9EUKA|nr:hypothetical protein SARC_12936 [Sphaeroforma arctica JP610]KNC74522.1 hypothetical protein SARC_12936 [Sphaeroforma arctica JP610]|eukprot:XP_014148424.1 hypothetical protein SARC_12936 [Sphaeroforma arctica JP610]
MLICLINQHHTATVPELITMTPSANVHTSIDDLPLDVLEYIYSFLPLETLPSVASASKRLRMGATAKVRADLLMRDCISDHFCADHVLRLPQMYCLLALRIVGGGILVDLAGHPGELPEEMLGYTQPPFEVVTSALHQVVTYVDLTDVPSRAQVCDCLTQCFVRACEQGDLDIVKFIVEELKYDPSTYRSTGLITAARHNRVKVYKYLHAGGRSDPSLQTNMAIGDACSLGYLEMARLLLLDDRVDPGM